MACRRLWLRQVALPTFKRPSRSAFISAADITHLLPAVAAGLRCTLANHAYNARELAFQYTDSGAGLIFTSEAGVATVRATFKDLGLSASDAEKRIIVLPAGLDWAGGPAVPRKADSANLLTVADFLGRGALKEEERFDGPQLSRETVYLCYSSGTTGKPKGVEVKSFLSLITTSR